MRAGMLYPLWGRCFLAGSVLGHAPCRIDLACRGNEVASAGEVLGAGASTVGEQAVMPDAVEPLGRMRNRRMNSPGSSVIAL